MSRFLKRIEVDFNTLNSALEELVKLASPGSWQEQRLPPLRQGERVLLYDADGLEVEATIIHDEAGWWLAAPDGATWRDTMPTDNPLPSLDASR